MLYGRLFKQKEKERKEKKKRKKKMKGSRDEVGQQLCLSLFALCPFTRALFHLPQTPQQLVPDGTGA